jgi:magnesium chelatase family protein
MIAKRIPTILPKMTEEEALEVTKLYSISGLLKSDHSLILQRPFRAPHHNASLNALIGGGNLATPGEVSRGEVPPAHNGVLFLDEIAEFSRRTLDALRQPMGHITCVRGVGSPVAAIICHGWGNVNLVIKIKLQD